jgi:hypothetical protein
MNWRPIVLGVVLVGLAGAIYYAMKGGAPPLPEGYQSGEHAATEAQPGAPEAKVEQVEQSLEQEKSFIYNRAKLRNPMTPFVEKPSQAPGATRPAAPRGAGRLVTHTIDGIMWSPVNPLAIIGGKVIGVGESLKDGSKVTEIGRSYVVLKRGARTVRLVLK